MFRFLTGLLTRRKKKDTEIRQLKVEVSKQVEELKAKAKKGDSDATLKLASLRETITEQSIRLTGSKRPPTTIVKPGAP